MDSSTRKLNRNNNDFFINDPFLEEWAISLYILKVLCYSARSNI